MRVADPSDAPLIAELGRRTFYETFAESNRPEDMDAYAATAFDVARIADEVRQPTAVFLIAESSATPVGFAKLEVAPPPPPCVAGPSPLRLHKLYVIAEALGTGVGATLMRSAIGLARAEGHRSLWLGVWEHNLRARAFYERWGFRQVGTESFRLGSDDQVDLLMELPLAEVANEAKAGEGIDTPHPAFKSEP